MTSVRKRPIILLVDDSEDDLGFLQLALESEPSHACRTLTARNGEEGLSMLSGTDRGAQRPDIVLVDLNMPRMDGRTMIRTARSNPELSWLPFVVLSTSGAPSDIAGCYQAGCNAYYQKPLKFQDLERLVGRIVEHWFDDAKLPDAVG